MIDASKIKAANALSLAGWKGIDLANGKQSDNSDRQLLSLFCKKVLNARKNKVAVTIGQVEIRDLMKACHLGPLFLKNEIDYSGLSDWLSVEDTHRRIDNAIALPFAARCDETLEMLKEVAGALHSEDDGQQIALASRILFFALPDLPFFNVSSGVAQKLNIPHHIKGNLKLYWDTSANLLEENHAELSKCERPSEFSKRDNDVINAAEKGEWWLRRVLDYAILAD